MIREIVLRFPMPYCEEKKPQIVARTLDLDTKLTLSIKELDPSIELFSANVQVNL